MNRSAHARRALSAGYDASGSMAAVPTRFMTHLAMLQVGDDGTSAKWGAHVSDEEFRAAPIDTIEGNALSRQRYPGGAQKPVAQGIAFAVHSLSCRMCPDAHGESMILKRRSRYA